MWVIITTHTKLTLTNSSPTMVGSGEVLITDNCGNGGDESSNVLLLGLEVLILGVCEI